MFIKLWKMRKQFIKYFTVGLSSFFLDIFSLILLKEYLFISATLAVIINQILIIIYNFNLNKYWTFKNKAIDHKQFVRYLTLVLFNYFFSVAVMYIFNELLNFDYRLVRTATIIIMVMWNFFIYKFWVYRKS
ncbi:MAG: GtrA family protein [Patescibacteria group bacterium]